MYERYDWNLIKRRFLAGETPYRIARTPGMPTRQAIHKRAAKENWAELRKRGELTIVDESPKNVNNIAFGKFTRENRALIVESLRGGANLKLAAARTGINPATLSRWRKDHPGFRQECDAAMAEFAMRHVTNVDHFSERDWKASQFLLQHHKLTKEYFAPEQHGPSLNISFMFSRDAEVDIPGVIVASGSVDSHAKPLMPHTDP